MYIYIYMYIERDIYIVCRHICMYTQVCICAYLYIWHSLIQDSTELDVSMSGIGPVIATDCELGDVSYMRSKGGWLSIKTNWHKLATWHLLPKTELWRAARRPGCTHVHACTNLYTCIWMCQPIHSIQSYNMCMSSYDGIAHHRISSHAIYHTHIIVLSYDMPPYVML